MMRRHCRSIPAFSSSAFAGFRFPPEIIVLALRWYLRFGLSYRDVEELLANVGSRSTTSLSTGGCSASRDCSRTRPDRAGMRSVTVGSWTRRT